MKNKIRFLSAAFVIVTWFACVLPGQAQGTAFTYQGRLNDASGPVSGNYDFIFSLYNAATNGTAIGTVTNTAVPVNNGMFITLLDYRLIPDGSLLWLDISVGTNGSGIFTNLVPRQPLTPVPYALFANTAGTLAPPAGMVQVPAGTFNMGDSLDGEADAAVKSTTISACYMDQNLVSYSQWQSILMWATNSGYIFVNPGTGKAGNQPVQSIDWYDAVKWCNARSQIGGRMPVYYTDAAFTHVFTNGQPPIFPKWAANGFRLPTEAEWEWSARGGLAGQRFPWGNLISESQANYIGNTALAYDLGPNGNNAIANTGASPFTTPVGTFPANAYGLFDMAGNVDEWCWDYYATSYAGGPDPRGAFSGTLRVLRGGSWSSGAVLARSAHRSNSDPTLQTNHAGFRCVRGM